MKRFITVALIHVTLVVAAGCAASQPASSAAPAPHWVIGGSGAFDNQVRGVGSAPPSATQARAVAHAHEELEKVAGLIVAHALKIYANRGCSIGAPIEAHERLRLEDQRVEAFVARLRVEVMKEARVSTYWHDPVDRRIYALAELPISAFLTRIDQTDALPSPSKARLRESALLALRQLLVENEEKDAPSTSDPS